MKANLQYEKCANCQERQGTEPIFDDEGTNFWVCEYCHDEIFEETTFRQEGLKDED